MKPKASVIILNWNNHQDTAACLNSLLEVSDVDFEVVLVDNGSTDGSAHKLARWAQSHEVPLSEYSDPNEQPLKEISQGRKSGMQHIILFSLSTNLGFCAGNNLGIRQAKINGIPYAVILNNDTIIEPNFLSTLIDYAEADPSIGLLGCQIRYADARNTVWWAGGTFSFWLTGKRLYDGQLSSRLPDKPYPTEWVSGCMTLIPLPVFSRLGGYDERFFIWCDEWDLSLRVSRAGYKMMVVPSSVIYHKIGKSLGLNSPLTYYYSARNLLLLRRCHLTGLKWVCFLILYTPYKLLQAILHTIKFGKSYWTAYLDAILDFAYGRFGQWHRHYEGRFG